MKPIIIFLLVFFQSYFISAQSYDRYIVKTTEYFPVERLSIMLNNSEKDKLTVLFDELNLYLLETSNNASDKIDNLKRNKYVDFLVKDSKLEYRTIPDDPNFGLEYGMTQINADKVWDFNTGGLNALGDTIVIAVLDKGMETTHLDLKENIWRNPGEIPGDNIDNDSNGYVDDYFGLDMVNKNDVHNNHFHGTGVAGIIGAKGNNGKGMAGVNWNIKILPITNVNYVSDVIKAYNYVLNLRKKYNDTNGSEGAFIVATNLSAGKSNSFPEDSPENIQWCNIYNLLGNEGILNTSSATNDPVNVEKTGDLPTLCSSDYLIPVTSTDENDEFDTDRSFGITSIDIAAPGKNIYTLDKNNGYREKFTGNSAAAPFVAGAIGLLYTIPCSGFADKFKANPAEFSLEIKKYLLDFADKHDDLLEKTSSGGRLNVYNTYLHLAEDFCEDLNTGDFDITKTYPNPARNSINIEYSVDNFEPHTLEIYDAIGRKVYFRTFRPNIFGKKVLNIDIFRYAKGVYYIKLISNDKSVNTSFVKI